uniref:THD domain-containing protein n=1 Tax=Knipowitschia caucasica TaxID=637954 RepID=A0AAV2LKT7_KNICA
MTEEGLEDWVIRSRFLQDIKQRCLTVAWQKAAVPSVVMFGLVLEGIFIYRLHQRTEELFLSQHSLQNQSRPHPSAGIQMQQLESIESNEIPTAVLHSDGDHRPMAHLQGTDGVVQWVRKSESFTSHMGYNSSGLQIQKQGFYYVYSKVHLQETDDCVMVNHRVVRNTTHYGLPIELMRAKSLHCRNERPNQKKWKEDTNLWNSFLAGIFELEIGDHIFVTQDKGLYSGPADNFFGAFRI